MKILIVHDTKGNILIQQRNLVGNYKLLITDIPEDKEVIGIDSKGQPILKDRLATTEELKQSKEELKNKDNELLALQAQYAEDVYNNLLK